MYLSQSTVFVPLLELIFYNWMKQGSILQHFSRSMVKLLRKNKNCVDWTGNFRPLTMLNTELNILSVVNWLRASCCEGKDYSRQPLFCKFYHRVSRQSTGKPSRSVWISPRHSIMLTIAFWRLFLWQPVSGRAFVFGSDYCMLQPVRWWKWMNGDWNLSYCLTSFVKVVHFHLCRNVRALEPFLRM